MIKDRKINLVNLALVLYIFSIVVFDEGANILKIVRIFFVGISIIHIIKNEKFFFNGYIKWGILFLAFSTLSLAWSISTSTSKAMVLTLIYNFICGFCMLNILIEQPERIILTLKTIMIASIFLFGRVIAIGGIFSFLNTRSAETISANTVGLISAISTIFGIYLLKEKKTNKRILFAILTIVNLIIIILSASRKAILFLLIPLIIYYIMQSKNILKLMRNIVLILIIIIFVYMLIMNIPFLYDMVGYRIETMINGFAGEGDVDASTSTRLTMIEWGLKWFKESPIKGYGIDCYRKLLGTMNTTFGNEGTYAHNNYVELLVDVGIVGTVIYYSIYLTTLIKLIGQIKNKNTLQIISLGILISFIINEYGMVSYYAKFNQTVLLIIYVVANIGTNKVKGEE